MTHGITVLLLAVLTFLAPREPAPIQVEEGFVIAPGGTKLHYRLAGSGRDTIVVIADGPGGHMGMIAPDLATLARRHRLLFYDQRGSGTSTTQTSELRVTDHVRDLEAIRMSVGIRQYRVLAHGWGAAIAAQYAIEHPDRIARLALVAPIAVRRQHLDAARAAFDGRLDDLAKNRLAAARADTADPIAACSVIRSVERAVLAYDASVLRGNPCAVSPAALAFTQKNVVPAAWSSLADYDFRRALAAVTVPVLVVHGAADLTPLASAEEWTTALPNARLLVLQQAAHYPYAEAAATFNGAMDVFMGGGWPEGAVVPPRVIANR